MAIRNFYPELCTGCGNCVAACPMDVLRMGEDDDLGVRPDHGLGADLRKTAKVDEDVAPSGAADEVIDERIPAHRDQRFGPDLDVCPRCNAPAYGALHRRFTKPQ